MDVDYVAKRNLKQETEYNHYSNLSNYFNFNINILSLLKSSNLTLRESKSRNETRDA
jgi:hypothetical protein